MRSKLTRLTAVGLVLAAGLLAGCGNGSAATETCPVGQVQDVVNGGCKPVFTPAPTPTETPTQTPPPTTGGGGGTATVPNDPALCEDLEGCFNEAGMFEFYTEISRLVNNYLAATYKTPSYPEYIFVNAGDIGPTGCKKADGSVDNYNDEFYAYCPGDGKTYVGQKSLWRYYSQMGDAAPAVGLAHEVIHHVQDWAGVDADVLTLELQADCGAGAWAAYMRNQGIMHDQDFADIDLLMIDIGAMNLPNRDHGTTEERVNAFLYGFEGGLVACNEYVPATPLIS